VTLVNHPESRQIAEHPFDSGPVNEIVICEVDVNAGSLDMPASLLAQLTPNAAMPAELLVDLANVETLRREGWLFTFGVPLMPGPVSVDLRPHG